MSINVIFLTMRATACARNGAIKAAIYAWRRWIVCSDTQIVTASFGVCVCVCAHPFACGYQQTASHTGECKRVSMHMCSCVCILVVNLLEIHDTLRIDCMILTKPAPCASLKF